MSSSANYAWSADAKRVSEKQRQTFMEDSHAIMGAMSG